MDWINFLGGLFAGGGLVASVFAVRGKLAAGRAPQPATVAAKAAEDRRIQIRANVQLPPPPKNPGPPRML
ncbi:MAG: hypothetical protein HOW73_45450 [Polyangiaceae bacterium]|nr:hypothetical protein [Polyangiaceae bacterium]